VTTLKDGVSVALAGVYVQPWPVGSGMIPNGATTDSKGKYILSGVEAGRYTLSFSKGSYLTQWLGGTAAWNATEIPVSTSMVTGKDAVLVPAASISGVVKNDDGDPIPNVNVWFSSTQGSGGYNATTDAAGKYSATNLPAGSYIVQFSGGSVGNYLTEFWNNKKTMQTSTPVPVKVGENKTGISPTLAVAASVSGNVKGAGTANINLANVDVSAVDASGNSYSNATTDSAGNYTIKGLPAGSWTLQFSHYGSEGFAPEYWNDKSSLASATFFAVGAEQAVTGKNAVLVKGGSISGTVTGAGGTALANSYVYLQDSERAYRGSAQTDAAGKYNIPALPAGSYRLSFQDSSRQYITQWWKGKSSFESADSITVAAGQSITKRDVTLVKGSTLSGEVTDSDGKKITGVQVPVWQKTGSEWERVNAGYAYNGTYSIPGLAAGTYKVGFTDYATGNSYDGTGGDVYADEFYSDKPTLASATEITVKAGQSTALDTAVMAVKSTLKTLITTTPTITGTAAVGKKLTAVATSWSPSPTLSYQWNKDGAPIAGATASTYTPVAADLKGKLTVSVTGTKPGYTTVSKTTAATKAVVAGTLTTKVPTITGTAAVGKKLTAIAGAWSPSPTLSYQWKRNGVAISGATKSTYTAVAADLKAKLTVSVSGSRSGYTTVAKTSVATKAVVAGTFTTKTPTITGTATVGKKLTAVAGTWSPAPTLTYQWKRNGVAISGATKPTYTLVKADSKKSITVTVTGKKSGFTTAIRTSTARKIG
jgi:hypothetical protein